MNIHKRNRNTNIENMKKGLLEPKLETCFENDTLKYQFLKNNQLIAAKTRKDRQRYDLQFL